MTPDDLDARLGRLRNEWPAPSIADEVMARIGREPARPRRSPLGRRVAALAAAAGLLAGVGLAWMMVFAGPRSLLASVQDGLARSRSAHLVMTGTRDGVEHTIQEIWYRRDEGFRAETPGQIQVDDGRFLWSWRLDARDKEPVAVRRRSEGFAAEIAGMLALSDVSAEFDRAPAPDLDRAIGGVPCRAVVLVPRPGGPPVPGAPRGAVPVDKTPFRMVALSDPEGRVREFAFQGRAEGRWVPSRTLRIDYDLPVDPSRLAADLPRGAKVVDADAGFEGRHPLDQAPFRVDIEGLTFAVHDLRPLEGGGYAVVSSVRGTREFLRRYPPRRRRINMDLSLLDVAFQPMGSELMGAYDRIVLGHADREGVNFSWWLIFPRRVSYLVEGKRVFVRPAVPNEPKELEVGPGRVRLPMAATFWGDRLKDARGVLKSVLEWVDVGLAPGVPPATLDEAAARAHADVRLMRLGADANLWGVADGPPPKEGVKPLMRIDPDRTTEADFAAAVRRAVDDFLRLDILDEPEILGAPTPAR